MHDEVGKCISAHVISRMGWSSSGIDVRVDVPTVVYGTNRFLLIQYIYLTYLASQMMSYGTISRQNAKHSTLHALLDPTLRLNASSPRCSTLFAATGTPTFAHENGQEYGVRHLFVLTNEEMQLEASRPVLSVCFTSSHGRVEDVCGEQLATDD